MGASRQEIRFLLNDREVHLPEVGAAETLLDYLRLDRLLRGTKEGCAEGDCGACTVLVGRMDQDALRYETVNACIRFLPSLDGCHVVTVEHLAGADGSLHPVQKALVDLHGSQCGFCTPGIVMSLYGLWMENPDPTEGDVETALQGNLCRCTGYAPIIQAALSAARNSDPATDALSLERDTIVAKLQAMRDGCRVVVEKAGDRAILPADVDDLATVLLETPDATIIAGSTDVGLWVTKHMRSVSPAVFIGHLDGLKHIDDGADNLTFGAGVSYSDAQATILARFPHLAEYWSRIGGWQVRNMGTLGGNIANGSPIGDTPPVLISLGALITLRKGRDRRRLLLEDFFIDYGKQDRAAGEFVEAISIPHPAEDALYAAYKISKRRDEDISAVCCGLSVHLRGGQVVAANLAYGGMAAIPKRAKAAEAALVGKPWCLETVLEAAEALASDFSPISDWRASADYRMRVAQNLLRRFFEESRDSDDPVRLSA